ncbi:MAG: hypothetical protein ABSG21_08165 [Spirochaetia bacterium]|jgi:hypothetical protein
MKHRIAVLVFALFAVVPLVSQAAFTFARFQEIVSPVKPDGYTVLPSYTKDMRVKYILGFEKGENRLLFQWVPSISGYLIATAKETFTWKDRKVLWVGEDPKEAHLVVLLKNKRGSFSIAWKTADGSVGKAEALALLDGIDLSKLES